MEGIANASVGLQGSNKEGFDYYDDDVNSSEFDIDPDTRIEYDKYSEKFIWCCNIISVDQMVGFILEENGNIMSQFISAIKPDVVKLCGDKFSNIAVQDGDAPGYIIVYFK